MAAEWPQAPPRRYRMLNNGQVILIPYDDDKVENVFDSMPATTIMKTTKAAQA
jgi:hypothetical protein